MESLSPANFDKYSCKKCFFKATCKIILATHLKSVHRGQKFQCPECDYEATQKSSLNTHMKSIHRAQKFYCPECDHEFTWKRSLANHLKSSHKGQQIQCPEWFLECRPVECVGHGKSILYCVCTNHFAHNIEICPNHVTDFSHFSFSAFNFVWVREKGPLHFHIYKYITFPCAKK